MESEKMLRVEGAFVKEDIQQHQGGSHNTEWWLMAKGEAGWRQSEGV